MYMGGCKMNKSRALNTEEECEKYLFSEFPEVARNTVSYLRMLVPILGRSIGNDLYRIKGYTRKDGIGFCIVKKDDGIFVEKVRSNFLVLKPGDGVVDYFHRGSRNNFDSMGFKEFFDDVSEDQLNDRIGTAFSGRALDKNLSVQWSVS